MAETTQAATIDDYKARAARVHMPTERHHRRQIGARRVGQDLRLHLAHRRHACSAKVAACDTADVDARRRAPRAPPSRRASGRARAPAERKKILLQLADADARARDELALLETLDMGKPIRDSTRVDIPGCGQLHRLVRRGRRQDLRRDRAHAIRARSP